MVEATASPEVAYYYPAPYWAYREVDLVKPLLLFFDEIAILRPRYMHGIERLADPVLAGPLQDLGLLRVLEPESFVDQTMTEDLATALVHLITEGAFDSLDRSKHFQELSQSRMGWNADVDLAAMLVEELVARDLARPSQDGLSLPLHPEVRTTVLVLLAQLARAAGRRQGLDLHPTSPGTGQASSLIETLTRAELPSAGHVVALDLEAVTLDVARVPLDELIEFRDEHAAEYRAYAKELRSVVRQLGPLDPAERESMLEDRRVELADRAHALRRISLKAWRPGPLGLASVSIGLAGAAWELAAHSDPITAALAAVAGLTGALPARTVDAYSYVIAADRHFS